MCKITYEFPKPCELASHDEAAKKCYLGNFQSDQEKLDLTIGQGTSHVYIENGITNKP